VPIAVITGDQYVGPEATPFCPGIASVEVKRSISRYAAQHSHPAVARELVRDGVRAALSGNATLALTDDEPLRLHRAFITLVYLTRSLVESY